MCSRRNHSLANAIFNWLLSFLPAFLKVNVILIQVKNFVNYVIHQKACYLFFKQLQKLLSNFLNQDIPNVFKTSFQLLNKTRFADQKVDLFSTSNVYCLCNMNEWMNVPEEKSVCMACTLRITLTICYT